MSEDRLLYSLTQQPGWKVLEKELKKLSNAKLQKLRRCNRDSAFYKIQGALDTIDEIFRMVQYKINDKEE